MSPTTKTTCDKCGKDARRFKLLKKMNGGRFCKGCAREKRLKHREFLKRDVCGIRTREQQIKDWEKDREEKEKRCKKLRKIVSKSVVPDIKSIRKNRVKISSLGIYITKDEKNVLYKKLVGLGFDSKTASERIDNLCTRMEKVVEKLRETVKTKEDLDKRFKEEFGKMCMELESGGLE